MPEHLESKPRDYQIEHLPDSDIILNLDYKSSEDRKAVLRFLKEPKSINDKIDNLKNLHAENNSSQYFVKQKKYTGKEAAGITERWGFERGATVGLRSVLNEILLSKRVREIIVSGEAQEIARKYGFGGIRFVEPIAGIIIKDGRKFLVYKNIRSKEVYEFEEEGDFNFSYSMPREIRNEINNKLENAFYNGPPSLAEELYKLFSDKGVIANDLRPNQFMLTKQDDTFFLNLIDVEAYRTQDSEVE